MWLRQAVLVALLLCCVEKATAIDSGKAGTVRGRARDVQEKVDTEEEMNGRKLMMMNKGGKKGGKKSKYGKGKCGKGNNEYDGGCGLYAPSPMPSVHWPPEPGFYEGGQSPVVPDPSPPVLPGESNPSHPEAGYAPPPVPAENVSPPPPVGNWTGGQPAPTEPTPANPGVGQPSPPPVASPSPPSSEVVAPTLTPVNPDAGQPSPHPISASEPAPSPTNPYAGQPSPPPVDASSPPPPDSQPAPTPGNPDAGQPSPHPISASEPAPTPTNNNDGPSQPSSNIAPSPTPAGMPAPTPSSQSEPTPSDSQPVTTPDNPDAGQQAPTSVPSWSPLAPTPTVESSDPSPTPGSSTEPTPGNPTAGPDDSGTVFTTTTSGEGEHLSTCINPPEESEGSIVRTLAFEYAMLVDAGTTVEDVDAIVGKVEKSLHDAIAVAILDCNFPSNRRNLQEDELHVVTVLSLPEDERESTECLQEEVSEGTDCYSVLAPFTLYYLYDGSLQGLVTILESSIGDFMQSMDSATLDAIDLKLRWARLSGIHRGLR